MTAPEQTWLSPTRAWGLINCPASVIELPTAGEWTAALPNDGTENAGTIAHRAMERWIQDKGYQAADPTVALAEVADGVVGELGQDIRPPRWALVRARLVTRGAALAAVIGSRTADQILCETQLVDPALKLRGTPDLLLLGPEIVLVDLKTQTLRQRAVPEWAAFQLNFYAHLVSMTCGELPRRVEIFSLNRGQIPLDVSEATVAAAIDKVQKARLSTVEDARPDPKVCLFCARRFVCGPHWDAALDWPDGDCVEGDIERIEIAENGLAAILVKGSKAKTWVTGIPGNDIPGAIVGGRIRLIRLYRARPTSEDQNTGWRWRPTSGARIATSVG